MQPLVWIARVIDAQRGHLFPWVPVCLGLGIGVYFSLPVEPPVPLVVGCACGAVLACGLGLWRSGAVPLFCLAIGLVLAGISLSAMRTHLVAAPVLEGRYYGPITGRLVGLDRSSTDRLRVTLTDVLLRDYAVGETPRHVRLALHGVAAEGPVPEPGQVILMTGHLQPPQGPTEPGGFQFQRHAWFQGLGAVGYTRTPILLWEERGAGLYGLRMQIAAALRDRMPDRTGGFAAAILVGDRSALDGEVVGALRISNLAHLLAISGLHMGLLTGVVLGALRAGLALWPRVALRWPIKSWAAAGALIAASVYLLLSGASVASQRAFIMVAVVLLAVMLHRRALTLRAVALAAILVLILRPEGVLSPGFQMSFAATTALVAVFGWLRDRRDPTRPSPVPKWAQGAVALVMSSAVAGAATAPFAAATFNQIAPYGLVANLLTVPVMGAVVMPGAVLATILWPFGLEQVGLMPMHWGIAWILTVAEAVAALDGARQVVPAPPPWALPVLSLGALVIILWQGRARWLGAMGLIVALIGWMGVDRPPILITPTGRLVGVVDADGLRQLSRPRGEGFSARSWLEHDGDARDQARAAEGWGDGLVAALWTKATVEEVRAACRWAEVVVTPARLGPIPGADCLVFDAWRLSNLGAVALWRDGAGWRIESARQQVGHRPWTRAQTKKGPRDAAPTQSAVADDQ